MIIPDPPLDHLFRLSDGTGVFEHAVHTSPRTECGYCTDDVARALVVVLRERSSYRELRRLEVVYLDFLTGAALPEGRFHNRLSAEPDCRWLDAVGSDDSAGRAVWALGAEAAHGSTPGLRARAFSSFERATVFDSPHPRSNAAAILGAVEVLTVEPGHRAARDLVESALPRLGAVGLSQNWPWPQARLSYENARLPAARIAAGWALGDHELVEEGLLLLEWLVDIETTNGHFSFASTRGWARGEPRPAFDQQPVEAGAMADACAWAFAATHDSRWADACARAAAWFLGQNDVGVPLLDATTGGCHDGLERNGVNLNEGAESTIAMIGALQDARATQTARRRAASSGAASTTAAPT